MSELQQIVCPHDGAINRLPAARLRDAPRCGRCHEPLFAGGRELARQSGALANPDHIVRWVESALAGSSTT